MLPIISKREALRIIHLGDGKIKVSLDLGLTFEEVDVSNGAASIRDYKIPLKAFEKVKEDCLYVIDEEGLKKAAMFSEETNFYYKLMPTTDWPTLLLSSTPMHRYTKTSPKNDTRSKIKEVSPVKGVVLDTCGGLGYTAIMASRYADKVFVFEKDPNVLHVAGFNPYSQELFFSKKVQLKNEDVFESIKKFDKNFFDRIIHDPPTFKYAPLLYSKVFYKELFRVLKSGGIIYHYAPSPHKTRGEIFYPKIIRNLKEAGFKDAAYSEKSSGIRAVKR